MNEQTMARIAWDITTEVKKTVQEGRRVREPLTQAWRMMGGLVQHTQEEELRGMAAEAMKALEAAKKALDAMIGSGLQILSERELAFISRDLRAATPQFDEAKMRRLVEKDAFLYSMFKRLCQRRDESAVLRAMFNSEVVDDSVMEREYHTASERTGKSFTASGEWNLINVDGIGIRAEVVVHSGKMALDMKQISEMVSAAERKARSDVVNFPRAGIRINTAGVKIYQPMVDCSDDTLKVRVLVEIRWSPDAQLMSWDDVEEMLMEAGYL
jgi:hypothetical protein